MANPGVIAAMIAAVTETRTKSETEIGTNVVVARETESATGSGSVTGATDLAGVDPGMKEVAEMIAACGMAIGKGNDALETVAAEASPCKEIGLGTDVVAAARGISGNG